MPAHLGIKVAGAPEDLHRPVVEIEELPPASGLLLLPISCPGKARPVINLKALNQFVLTENFKMEGIHNMLKNLLHQTSSQK